MNNMKNNFLEQYKQIIHIVLNIITVFMTVFLIASIYYMIQEFTWEYNYKRDEDGFYYSLKEEQYDKIVDSYYLNMQIEEKPDEALTEYYGIAKYYEATFFLKAYEEAGDAEAVQRVEADREQAYTEMGEYAFLTKKIDKK